MLGNKLLYTWAVFCVVDVWFLATASDSTLLYFFRLLHYDFFSFLWYHFSCSCIFVYLVLLSCCYCIDQSFIFPIVCSIRWVSRVWISFVDTYIVFPSAFYFKSRVCIAILQCFSTILNSLSLFCLWPKICSWVFAVFHRFLYLVSDS